MGFRRLRRRCREFVLPIPGVIALSGPALAARPLGSPGGTPERSWSVQLHIHGPISEENGSIDWHVGKARESGVDALWWTDHDWRLYMTGYTQRFDFENCAWNPALAKWVEPDGWEQRYFGVLFAVPTHSVSVVDTTAFQGSRSFRLEVADPLGTSGFQPLELAQTTSRRQNRYSLATNPRLRFALRPESFDPANDKFAVQVTLSERSDGWPRLRYVAGSLDGEPADAIPLACVPGQWNVLELDVAGDARARFSAGGADTVRAQDHSMFELRFHLATRHGRTAVVFLDDLRFLSDPGVRGAALLDWQRAAAAWYEAEVPEVRHFVGSELSYFKVQQHMNAYAPNHVLVDYTGRSATDSVWYAVEQVHAQGGIVSFDHPFGIGIYGNPSETPEWKAARILKAKLDGIATRLYGCDLLEVGYRVRHGIDLAGHLSLWDCLTANALFVTGIGVTDTHGSSWSIGWAPWRPSVLYENNYVTWVWATQLAEVPLIDALAAGRASFGDPYRWQGELDFRTLDGFPMGRVVLTDKPSHDVVVRVTNVPSTVEVRLRQGEIRDQRPSGYTTANWLRDETLSGSVAGGVFCDTVSVDASVPSFVRVEVHDAGKEQVFSNPLHFVRRVPPDGIAARRLGASLDVLRVTAAEGLVLRDAVFDGPAARLRLVLDESTPGLGALALDVAALGPPVAVVGAATWSFDAGELHLDGFSGAGSEVTVSWAGGLAAPAGGRDLPRDVTLTTGRPNPFGRGLVAEYTLPAPAAALVEVLDVAGRRVRILTDEWTPAGTHPVAWDGRDASGRPAADGVYFLRLRAAGTTVTTKAVKIR